MEVFLFVTVVRNAIELPLRRTLVPLEQHSAVSY